MFELFFVVSHGSILYEWNLPELSSKASYTLAHRVSQRRSCFNVASDRFLRPISTKPTTKSEQSTNTSSESDTHSKPWITNKLTPSSHHKFASTTITPITRYRPLTSYANKFPINQYIIANPAGVAVYRLSSSNRSERQFKNCQSIIRLLFGVLFRHFKILSESEAPQFRQPSNSFRNWWLRRAVIKDGGSKYISTIP